jgi:tripartite-type tricarboxylate transporter receptor subunit TctC
MTDKDIVLYLVKSDSPWKTLKDVAEFARNNPEKFRWGTTGRGGIAIPALVQFFQANNIPIEKLLPNQVMFKSGGEGPVALAGGHIEFSAQQIGESYGLIEGKKIRPVAVVFEKRLAIFPDVPTAAEAGYPMFDVVGWHGISGPPGLPKHVVDFWTTSLEKASKDPVFIEMFEKVHKVAVYLGPKEVENFVEKEYQKYIEISKYLGWRK